MHETPEDLVRLQDELDRSYEGAGSHLVSIHDKARLSAEELVAALPGMKILVVATASADGRPLSGPVDAFFHRGRWRFGTSDDALRHRHLIRRPAISVTHVEGEGLVVTAHGIAKLVDVKSDTSFQEVLAEKYGSDGIEFFFESPYWEIIPDRLFAADMRAHQQADQP